ncbi:hypothetical protein GCM10008107_24990 [Psychrosphaera saromensis]|uniref:Uncharacterized protein n=1 Tax=Psychrosphaera saromensis TaxID=716813 RepID=A0A2S7UWC8_9GAMM|nr:hypothetical protein [Psychrosphaera saromensis]PQJ54286.1 hypothetical protein BTO11_11890 [Psychrosphaera saromensis]GHB74541.1 hypothetical protein GCM10008107_24990 [Psychrosphaera saromensis]GLQ12612.1 hypothetical protein GCM10007917_00670 [Psychrosphaera saromensis]
MKFTEAKLEQAIIELSGEQGYPHLNGGQVVKESLFAKESEPQLQPELAIVAEGNIEYAISSTGQNI